MNRNAKRECFAEREACAAHIEHHAMPRVDDIDAGTFADTEGTQAAGFVRRAADVNHCGLATRQTCRKRAHTGGAGWERGLDSW